MSLLRALPALRAPPPRSLPLPPSICAARRVCVAQFSSSARICYAEPSEKAHNLFDALNASVAAVNTAAASTSSSAAGIEDDSLPPAAPLGSYPLHANPVRESKRARDDKRTDMELYRVSVKATRNNTLATLSDPRGRLLVTLTGGKLGFKKSNRNGYEAGYQCAVGIIAAMDTQLEHTDFDWKLNLNGFGQGRDAMLTALTTSVGENVRGRLKRVTDRTPIKIGGTRGQKKSAAGWPLLWSQIHIHCAGEARACVARTKTFGENAVCCGLSE